MHDTFRWLRLENQRGAQRSPNLKWLLLPPIIALALFLGPFQSGTEPAQPTAPAAASGPVGGPVSGPAKQPAEPTEPRIGEGRPELPNTLQVISTLVGVLLLGGVAIVVLRRLQGRTIQPGTYLGLRQSLRLGNRHSLHAVEFDGQILLVGECDGNLNVLRSAQDPRAVDDERTVLDRAAADAIEEDGAVPRDLVLPRPAAPARPAPASPTMTAKTAAPVAAAPSKAAATVATAQPTNLAMKDFKALLRRARTGTAT